MTITRRSLLASLGVALPTLLTVAGAEAATGPSVHRHKHHHARPASARGHHRKPHHTTASIAHPRPQA